jgi:catalase (peroxidase I)
MLVDRAKLLTLTVPEMTVLVSLKLKRSCFSANLHWLTSSKQELSTLLY